jgi:hypothetical protein
MYERQECDACRVHAQRTWPEANRHEPVTLQELTLEVVPAALGSNCDKDSVVMVGERGRYRRLASRIRHQSHVRREQLLDVILDEDPELPMNRDKREPCVARLLKAFDEQWPIAAFGQHVRVEIVALDAARVGHDDSANTERRELCPEPSHDFRPWKREQHVHPRPGRYHRLEHAADRHASVACGVDGPYPQRTIELSDSDRLTWCDSQYLQEVRGTCVGERHAAPVLALALVEKQQIHAANSAR